MSKKPNGTFQSRLLEVQRAANFTVADLARWYRRPHATVRCWTQGTQPSGGPLDRQEVIHLTGAIENLVGRKLLPLPRMPRAERMKKLEAARKAIRV